MHHFKLTVGVIGVLSLAAMIAVGAGVASKALARHEQADTKITMWDLELGSHASQLPTEVFADFACGTNGGPPSMIVGGWRDFGSCLPEAETGFFEIYFRYDDEAEFVARAQRLETQAALFGGTTAYAVPVIVSALFDEYGFLNGLRMVSDSRVDVVMRELGITLRAFVMTRYGEDWNCEDLERREGETEFAGRYLKRVCNLAEGQADALVTVEGHYYRKPGQFIVDPRTRTATEGAFISQTILEVLLKEPIANPEERLAALDLAEAQPDPLVVRAMNCPGCDLSGAVLKRADLRGANLEGANLEGANLHDARLDGANLRGANLSGTDLNKANLKRADLTGANLSRAMLFEAHLDGANLSGAVLEQALAGGISLIRANMEGASIRAVDLRDARMAGVNLRDADLTGSHLQFAQLRGADMRGAILFRAVLLETRMPKVDLTGADLRQADLLGADLREANLTDADLSYTRLLNSILIDAILVGTIFEGAELPAGFRLP
jgi:uncharacterized protein YjbI with pentapeptide repeats